MIILFSVSFTLDYSIDISPIIYENCTLCHREGKIGSFLPLTNYSEVFDNRFWIAYAIEGNQDGRHSDPIMPPWPADRSYSNLLDELYLTDNQIQMFLEWIDMGSPQGDIEEEYPMPDFPEGSSIGIPDLTLQMSQPYFIEGNYEDDYRCFIINMDNDLDIDLAAVEFIPNNLEAVHHALIVAVPKGSADYLEDSDENYGYECFGSFQVNNTSDILGGYAPGMIVREWPGELAQKIPANSDIILQIHYAPLYVDQYDQSSINIFYKHGNIDRYIKEYQMVNTEFALPPNQITEVTQSFLVSEDISLIQFLPHSHLLGKFWEIYAISSLTQDTIPIIRINDWDFDWQFFYSPEYMIHLPAGSIIKARCIYDNTINNPNNPNNPPQWTFWGEGTGDEMFYVPFRYIDYRYGDENIYLGDFISGDLNDDSLINILDVVLLANCVISQNCLEQFSFHQSDINGDNLYNVLDIVSLVNIIFNE